MKRCVRLLCVLVLTTGAIGCASTTQSTEPDASNEQPSIDAVAACSKAQREAELLVEGLSGSNASDSTYQRFSAAYSAWEQPDHPCSMSGNEATSRASTKREVLEKFARADERYIVNAVASHVGGMHLDDAKALLITRFNQGRDAGPEVQEAINAYSNQITSTLGAAFQESGRTAQLQDDLETTCVFSRREFDPQETRVETHFSLAFGGHGEIHTLCRLPLPASNYGGDDAGRFFLVLSSEVDGTGEITRVDLGPVESYDEMRYFRGRFGIPQGIGGAQSAYFRVDVVVERPTLGNETPVSAGFWWFADQP